MMHGLTKLTAHPHPIISQSTNKIKQDIKLSLNGPPFSSYAPSDQRRLTNMMAFFILHFFLPFNISDRRAHMRGIRITSHTWPFQ